MTTYDVYVLVKVSVRQKDHTVVRGSARVAQTDEAPHDLNLHWDDPSDAWVHTPPDVLDAADDHVAHALRSADVANL